MKQTLKLSLFLLAILNVPVLAQESTQMVKGLVTDKASEKPLSYVSVSAAGITAQTDSLGRYSLKAVPVGRIQITFQRVGYKKVSIPELLVTSGKQVVLDVALEENIASLAEVRISSGRSLKGIASNEFAGSSARSFSTEEASRYAGGRNDPAKLASNFAGVSTTDDSRNDIVVRGNSPSAVLWRMEGIPIPNPNHFTTLGTTGGTVSALNTNALKTSDFYTSAFPAEFGNATGAVFDIGLRNGNPDKFETTLQMNVFSGLEALVEGPLSKSRNGASFLVGYRYAMAKIGQSMGMDIGTSAPPRYQDLIFNLNFGKGRLGKLSLFGIGGLSDISMEGKDAEEDDFFFSKNEDSYFKGGFGAIGAKHFLDLGKNTFIRTIVSGSYFENSFDQYNSNPSLQERRHEIEQSTINTGWRMSSIINSKISAALNLRGGILAEVIGLDTYLNTRENRAEWFTQRNYDGSSVLWQPFIQGKYRFTDKLSLSAGLHGTLYNFNDTYSIEPRASVNYAVSDKQALSFSFGMHSQLQPLPVYLYREKLPDGTYDESNRDLDLTKAHHYVLGYEWRFAPDWRIKSEVYHQSLYDVPVEQMSSGFSILNAGADFTFPEKSFLVNRGTGSNSGVELTLEKFFSKGFYLLTTGSFFNSRYKGSDGISRNTTFNNKLVLNTLAGREFKLGRNERRTFTWDVKATYSGGRYYTPVNLAASKAQGREILNESAYNSLRLSDYFRFDSRMGYRMNGKSRKISQTFYLEFQNLTNNQNVFIRRYNAEKQEVGTVYQIGFFPDLMYRIQF